MFFAKAIFDHPHWAIIELGNPNAYTWNKPYRAKVYAKENGVWEYKLKSGWWWKSSMFPDSWSKQKIMEEVEYAIKNNKGLADLNGIWSAKNIFRDPSRVEWIDIDFVYVKDSDTLFTFYPVVK